MSRCSQLHRVLKREFNQNLPFYLQDSNSCCNSSHNVGVFFQDRQDLFKATLRRKVFRLEASRSMIDYWSGKSPHLHFAPLCLSRPAGGAVRPAAARWKPTLVLFLKPGAHKVGVVGETTALELEEAGEAISFPSIQKKDDLLIHLFKLKAPVIHLQVSSHTQSCLRTSQGAHNHQQFFFLPPYLVPGAAFRFWLNI